MSKKSIAQILAKQDNALLAKLATVEALAMKTLTTDHYSMIGIERNLALGLVHRQRMAAMQAKDAVTERDPLYKQYQAIIDLCDKREAALKAAKSTEDVATAKALQA